MDPALPVMNTDNWLIQQKPQVCVCVVAFAYTKLNVYKWTTALTDGSCHSLV